MERLDRMSGNSTDEDMKALQDELKETADARDNFARKYYYSQFDLEDCREVVEKMSVNYTEEDFQRFRSMLLMSFETSEHLMDTCADRADDISKLEEMRTNFVSNVSHEMRSPLTVLSGYLEIFSDNPPKDEKNFKLAIDNMYQQAMRMQRLVTDLLALSKMETAPVEHTKSVNVSTLLITLKENAEVLGQDKQHTITLKTDEKLSLRGNIDELHSLFSNLINNAVRYTPEHGRITISWQILNNEAVFSVSDDGPGIASQHIPHLTERFYRADIDRSRESGGTGLGLAIVKYAVERHDGRLEIRSTLGKGSTFTCYFPSQRFLT